MILLDTMVISELMRPRPDPSVLRWVDDQQEDLATTAITLADLLYGIGRLPDGQRKQGLIDALDDAVTEIMDYGVLSFDQDAAVHYAQIVVHRERAGEPISAADAQIAAICRSRRLPLATRNTAHFINTGARLLNPWGERPQG